MDEECPCPTCAIATTIDKLIDGGDDASEVLVALRNCTLDILCGVDEDFRRQVTDRYIRNIKSIMRGVEELTLRNEPLLPGEAIH